MKILKICTHPHGGAAIAALRQADALRQGGTECSFLSIKVSEDADQAEAALQYHGTDISILVPASIWGYNGRITFEATRENRTSISNTWFSFFPVETCFDDLLLKVCLEFDVIHFHWVSQMLSEVFVKQLAKHDKRVVFTGHDMNFFTGGCHYDAHCRGYEDFCRSCDQLIADPFRLVPNCFYSKLSSLSHLRATWVFPSYWLADCFERSRLQAHEKSSVVIHNCIDTDDFTPASTEKRSALRKRFGFEVGEVVLVAGTANNLEKRKGFNFLKAAVDQASGLVTGQQFVIVSFGRGNPEFELKHGISRHLHLGFLDETQVKELLQAADLFLIPSIEENFANTILESLMCGCPVLAFDIGGVPDIVKHDVNGWIVREISEAEYAKALLKLTDQPELERLRESTRDWRSKNFVRFSPGTIAGQLLDTYGQEGFLATFGEEALPEDLSQSRKIYKKLMGSCSPNSAKSHQLLARNLNRCIGQFKKTGMHQSQDRPLEIPCLLKGFSELSDHDGHRPHGWQLQDSSVFFWHEPGLTPALCIEYAVNQSGDTLSQERFESLSVEVNETTADYRIVMKPGYASNAYLWVLPSFEALSDRNYNLINLKFRQPIIDSTIDRRGLCARYSKVNVFDLTRLFGQPSDDFPDFETSVALNLSAGYEHYLWDEWTEKEHLSASLSNSVASWIDLITPAYQKARPDE